MENQFLLSDVIQIIWDALSGSDVADAFLFLGITFFNVMCFWSLFKVALSMAEGKDFKLTEWLFRWAIINGFMIGWPTFADKLYAAAATIGGAIMPTQQSVYESFMVGFNNMNAADQAANAALGTLGSPLSLLASLPTALITHQLSSIGMLVVVLCYIIVLLAVAGLYFILGAYLILGPVFIALGMTEEFAGFMYKWIGVVLSFFLVIPLYGSALHVITALAGGGAVNLSQLQGLPGVGHMFASLAGPIISIGIIFAVGKIASSLTGSYFGNTGSLAFSIGVAAAGIGTRMGMSSGGMGGAAAGTAAAGSAAKAASSSGGTSGPVNASKG